MLDSLEVLDSIAFHLNVEAQFVQCHRLYIQKLLREVQKVLVCASLPV